jgi:hypothetical protein
MTVVREDGRWEMAAIRMLCNLELLEVWERGSRLHSLDRALLLLAAVMPQESYDGLAEWPLGRRNAALAMLRRATFGSRLEGWVVCPRCAERLEFVLNAEALADDYGVAATEVTVGVWTFRLPNSRDLASVAGGRDMDAAAAVLLRRCLVGKVDLAADLAGVDVDTVGERIAEADPLAEMRVTLHCAECGHEWAEPLDIAAWLWEEIEARSRRLLLDVHTLAMAYGWSERDVLAMSESRRAVYLEMVQG